MFTKLPSGDPSFAATLVFMNLRLTLTFALAILKDGYNKHTTENKV